MTTTTDKSVEEIKNNNNNDYFFNKSKVWQIQPVNFLIKTFCVCLFVYTHQPIC